MANPWQVLGHAGSKLRYYNRHCPSSWTRPWPAIRSILRRAGASSVTSATPMTARSTLNVAGLLNDSVFQGDLLLGEEIFAALIPMSSATATSSSKPRRTRPAAVQQALQRALGDYGFRSETTAERLAAGRACRTRILPRSRVSAGWASCSARSAWRSSNGGTCWSAAANWPCSARPDIPAAVADLGRGGNCRPPDCRPFRRHRGGIDGGLAPSDPPGARCPGELLGMVLAMCW